MIPHSAPKTPAGKTQIFNKNVSFNVIALMSPRAHVFVYLRKLFGVADSEAVWIRKGDEHLDEHLSHGANGLRVVLGEVFIHYRIGQFRGNQAG